MSLGDGIKTCKHCLEKIALLAGRWIHRDTGKQGCCALFAEPVDDLQ